MKILHVISSGGMYGAEAVILNLSRTLNESSHCGVLAVFANSKNVNLELHDKALAEGIESHLIPCSGQIDRAAVERLQELADRTDADIVHAHGFKADIYAYFALRGSRIPLVSTCHNWIDDDLVVSLYGKADRFILRRYSAVIAVSEAVREKLLSSGVSAEKVQIIKNGIDLRPFGTAIPSLREGVRGEGAPIVGFVGRLSSEKGCDIFLRVASRVLSDVPSAKFVVVGDGPERKQLESLIDQLGIRGNVEVVGRRDDMPSVYASFDLMILSSHREGLPMAVLEGMASGLPWVASAVGEVPKVINDGCGFVVPPGDIDLCAAKVIALLKDPAERLRLGNGARERVEKEFSSQRMTVEYLNVYRQVVADGDSGVSRGANNKAAMQGKA